MGHDENNCQAYELMMDHGVDTYRMQVEEQGHKGSGNHGGQGRYARQGRGGRACHGRGQIIFYNCD